MAEAIVERGDVYRVSYHGTGHELAGPHYAVVITEEPYNRLSTLVVIPLSSGARQASFRPEVMIRGRVTRALVEQATTIDRSRLRELVASVAGTAAMRQIDESLRLVLGLDLPESDWI